MKETVEIEIDFGRIFRVLRCRWWVVLLAAMVGAAGCWIGSKLWITPRYTSSVIFYVSGSVTAPVDSAIVVLETDQTRREMLSYAGINRSEDEVEEWIYAEAVRTTDFLKVEVTAPDAVEAKVLADGAAAVLPRRVSEIMGNVAVSVVDEADFAKKPSTLTERQWAVLGAVLGSALAAGVIALGEIFRRKDDKVLG